MNVEKAIHYIRKNGSRFEQARLDRVLGLEFNRKEVLKGFSDIQNPDGGFPYADRKGFPSCLSNTTMALSNLIELGLGDSEPARKGIDFLLKMKKTNGTWPENEKIKPLEPPFWDMPGDEETTAWLTAAVADILIRIGKKVPKTTQNYLRGLQGPDGKFSGFIHTTWLAIAIFGTGPYADKHVATRALEYLETADIDDWDASCIAWCLESMKQGDADRASGLRGKLKGMLSDTQEPDGSWPSEGGERAKSRDAVSVLSALMDIILIENINP